MENFGFIYRTTNTSTGETYIGQHKNSHNDSSYIGSGKLLKKAIKTYGKTAFTKEILENCKSQDCLNSHEKYYIKREKALGKAEYNISTGGASDDRELMKKTWSNPELKMQKSAKTTEAWQNTAKRENIKQAQKASWASEKRKKQRSELMKEKWSDPSYAKKQREKLSTPNVLQQIALKNKITKNQQKDEIAKKTQESWHRRKHIPQEDYRRTCTYCNEEGKTKKLDQNEKDQILSSNKSQAEIAKIYHITKNEIILLRRAKKNG